MWWISLHKFLRALRMKIIILFIVTIFTTVSCTSKVHTAKPIRNNNLGPEYSNVGLSEPSAELKEKFPVCQKVLNVTWINKEKKIGYSNYDVYWRNGAYIDEYKAFVDLNAPKKRFTYKIVAYYPKNPRDGKENLIYDRMKKSKGKDFPGFDFSSRLVEDNFDTVLAIVKKYNSLDDFSGEKSNDVLTRFAENLEYNFLTAKTKNVCVIFPDNQYAWLAEATTIANAIPKEDLDKLYEELKFIYRAGMYSKDPGTNKNLFSNLSAYDINGDGEEDYFDSVGIVYSVKTNSREILYRYRDYSTCGVSVSSPSEDLQLYTDGKNFYFKDCNLTKLTSK